MPHAELNRARAFLDKAPAGATVLRIERFRRETIGSAVTDFVLDPGGVVTDDRPIGRALVWADAAGQPLAKLVIHPAPKGIESALLPMCMHAAAAAGAAEVQLWCESGTLLDGPRMMERWVPRDPIGRVAGDESGLRDDELAPAQRGPAQLLSQRGWTVRRAAGTVEAQRQWRKAASPWLLVVVPPLLFFGIPLFILRLWPNLFERIGDLWRAATRGSSSRLRYEISRSAIVVRCAHDGAEEPPIEIPREAVGALMFTPAGVTYANDGDAGSLAVIRTDGCTYLPHTAIGFSAVSTAHTAKTDREVGSALKELIRATIAGPG